MMKKDPDFVEVSSSEEFQAMIPGLKPGIIVTFDFDRGSFYQMCVLETGEYLINEAIPPRKAVERTMRQDAVAADFEAWRKQVHSETRLARNDHRHHSVQTVDSLRTRIVVGLSFVVIAVIVFILWRTHGGQP